MSQFGVTDELVLLFPGALGDFLCFGAGLAGLRRATRAAIKVVARPDWLDLLPPRQFTGASIDKRWVSELFREGSLEGAKAALGQPAAIWSWTGFGDRGFATRLGSLCARVEIFPFRGFAPSEHASHFYARCLGVSPWPVELRNDAVAAAWAENVVTSMQGACLAIHPGSGANRKNWAGFELLAEHWRHRGGRVVELLGPAEEGREPLRHADLVVREPLPRVAELLRRVALYAGNDSGISHLAAALGAPGIAIFAKGVDHWRPSSKRIAVVEAARVCAQCETQAICLHRLPIDVVVAALEQAWIEAQRWQVGQ